MFGRICGSLRAWCKNNKNRPLIIGVAGGMILLGVLIFLVDLKGAHTEMGREVERNSYGKGAKHASLIVKRGEEKSQVDIEVSERLYSEEERKRMFRRCIKKLEGEILGDNESLDSVEQDLNLVTELPGEPVEISWELDHYDVMNIYGSITEKNVKNEGSLIHLKAVLTYKEDVKAQALYECSAMVYPKKLNKREAFVKELREIIANIDSEEQTKEVLTLPESLGNETLHYYPKMEGRGIILALMGIVVGILLYALEIQKKSEQIKERRTQLLLDYPEVVNKLTLFIGAGMTVKRAWQKIVLDYEKSKEIWGERFVYEEMKYTENEMNSGITEAAGYERFGRRCDLQEYIRLGALLSQNLRKGTKGLNQILSTEASQALKDRKAMAKRLGEEAGTKLLLPMFLMLSIVLIIVIVPAFLSIRL